LRSLKSAKTAKETAKDVFLARRANKNMLFFAPFAFFAVQSFSFLTARSLRSLKTAKETAKNVFLRVLRALRGSFLLYDLCASNERQRVGGKKINCGVRGIACISPGGGEIE